MTNETAKIIKDSFEYVNKKYEAEAFEDGKKEGKKEVAKKLKSILPPRTNIKNHRIKYRNH